GPVVHGGAHADPPGRCHACGRPGAAAAPEADAGQVESSDMRVVAAGIAVACGLAVMPSARADDTSRGPSAPPAGDAAPKPWAAGVSAEDQAKALELYRQGNELFEQARYLDALAKYEVALAAWDHPSIRYN